MAEISVSPSAAPPQADATSSSPSQEHGDPDKGSRPEEESTQANLGEQTSLKNFFEAKEKQLQEMESSLPLTQTGTVEVITRSLTVFLAAALGGFIAFILRELHVWFSAGERVSLADLILLPMYILLAVIITLFLARVSEARFPLTIKVMDFWGALSLGILAALGGHEVVTKLLERLITTAQVSPKPG